MTTINAYLVFDGNCAEAMTFYHECLGGDLVIQTVKDSPMAKEFPPAMQTTVLHSTLTNKNAVLMGSDMISDGTFNEGNGMLLSMTCDNSDELGSLYEKLSAGGDRTREPHDFFAGRMAALKDKYGKYWVLYADK